MYDELINKTNHEPADEIHHAFKRLGGKYVGRIVPVKGGKEIDFSSIPGVRCVMPPPSRAEAEPKPAASVGKEDEASDHPMLNAKPKEKDDEADAD